MLRDLRNESCAEEFTTWSMRASRLRYGDTRSETIKICGFLIRKRNEQEQRGRGESERGKERNAKERKKEREKRTRIGFLEM